MVQLLESPIVLAGHVSKANDLLLGVLVEYASLEPEMQSLILLSSLRFAVFERKPSEDVGDRYIVY